MPANKGFGGIFSRKMAWNSDKCDLGLKLEAGVVLPATETCAEEAIGAIKSGKVIAVPTDTLYGFACDAWYDAVSFSLLFWVCSTNQLE